MECNKEDAVKLLDLSEKRFSTKDTKGALELAQKAQRLFPSLQNIQRTIVAYEVHLAASKSSPTDWHAVLCVHPSADCATIKKQFQKLCLLTHPDKNRSIAADGAFKIVMKAWSILSSPKASGTKAKKAEEKNAPTTELFTAKIRCQNCKLLRFWEFLLLDRKELYHYCDKCSRWGSVKSRSAFADAPLNCEGCFCNLSWGKHRPLGYECTNCGSYYVAAVDPNWIPKSQDKPANTTSFTSNTVYCSFCGAWTDKEVDKSSDCYYVHCKQCGLRSIIQLQKPM